jgi:type IV pilus assembly protein PilB
MPFWEPLKEMVLNGASTVEIKLEAIRLGMKSLRMSGVQKLREGQTTVDEVVRVTAADSV